MKKNLFKKWVWVLGAVLLLANTILPGMVAYANEPEPVATVWEQWYSTLEAAIEAANNETVKLMEDVTLTSALTIGKTVTIDLNWKTISKSNWTIISVTGEWNLTIDDESWEWTVKIAEHTSDWTVISVTGGWKATIKNWIYEWWTVVYSYWNDTEVVIETWDFLGTKAWNRAAIHATFGWLITIENWTFKAEPNNDWKPQKVIYAWANTNKCNSPDTAVNTYGPWKIVVKDWNFEWRVSRSNEWEYEIKWWTFKLYGDKTAWVWCDYNDCDNGTDDPTSCHDVSWIISMLNQWYVAKSLWEWTYSISYEPVATVWEQWYSTLEAAIEAANNETVKLMEDVTLTSALTIGKTVTIDLNWKTISKSNWTIISVTGEWNLTIDDESWEWTVKIAEHTSDWTVISVTGGWKATIKNWIYEWWTVVYSYWNDTEVVIETWDFLGTKAWNRAAIHATFGWLITIENWTFKAEPNNDWKPQKVIYAWANTNKCNSPDTAVNTYGPWKIVVKDWNFEWRVSRSNEWEYEIKWWTFKLYGDKTAWVWCNYNDCDNGKKDPTSCKDTVWLSSMVGEWYVAYKIDEWKYQVLILEEATEKEAENVASSNNKAIVSESTTVTFWDKVYSLVSTWWVSYDVETSSKTINWSWEETTQTVENTLSPSDVVSDSSYAAEIQWWIEVFIKKTAWSDTTKMEWVAKFSFPIALLIPVKSVNNIRVKAKHAGDAKFSFDWLTLNPKKWCNGKLAIAPYKWEVVDVIKWHAIIYTCSASTFVAYTETPKATKTTSSWGGGSSYVPSNKEETKVNTWEETKTIELKWEVKEETTTVTETKSDVIISDAAKKAYNEEQLEAYKWAYENGITTINDADKARLSDPLTRAELAKMMSQYISSVLKKDPIKTDTPKYSDVNEKLGDLADYIVKAYQYQIMGINADGTALEYFNPNSYVTRADYATVFSRVLYWSENNLTWDNYYSKHLAALKEAGILTNDVPTIQEVRGWVMLMMYRSAKTSEKVDTETPKEEENKAEESTWAIVWIANPASTYCVEQWWEVEIKENEDGSQYGMCKFKDGTEVEEWEYFRANHKDETSTWTVAEATTWAVVEATTWVVAETTTWATASTWSAE